MGFIFDDVVTEDLVSVLDAEQYIFDAFLTEAKEFLHCKVKVDKCFHNDGEEVTTGLKH